MPAKFLFCHHWSLPSNILHHGRYRRHRMNPCKSPSKPSIARAREQSGLQQQCLRCVWCVHHDGYTGHWHSLSS